MAGNIRGNMLAAAELSGHKLTKLPYLCNDTSLMAIASRYAYGEDSTPNVLLVK